MNEEIYDKDLDYSKIAKPFLAYAANGSVTSVTKLINQLTLN